MKIEGDGQLIRIFVDENDQHDGKPLYAAIVHRARSEGLAGATVLRGMMGFGANSLIHVPAKPGMPEDMPVVIEIVDREDKIARFLPTLDRMVKEGLVTVEKARVIFHRSSKF
ncbi:MAG: DUF190 domain-containing protein [Phycisphaerales bacterium]